MRKPLDKRVTLRPEPGPKAAGGSSVWPAFCLRLIASATVISLMFVLIFFLLPFSNADSYDPKELKHYAYKQMKWQEFECYNWLIIGESRWNPYARNGSHYGLAQMRNSKVRRLNGYQQIDWHIRYLSHRYNGSACKALSHFERYGWH